MMRKYFISCALSLIALIASAQIGAGQWKIHPYFVGDNSTNCIDTGSKIYYLSNGSLFCYDKATQANPVLDANGVLNDISISQIYYNYEKDYLVIVYDDCNIDILESNGNVVNVPAIKDVVMNRAKTINSVNFARDKAYIATSFGYIVLEDGSFNVIEVRNYDAITTSVAIIDDLKVMSIANTYYYCNADEQVELAHWHKSAPNSAGAGVIYPISNNKFFLATSSALYVVTMTKASDGTASFSNQAVATGQARSVQPTATGFVASRFVYMANSQYHNYDYYYTFDSNGGNATKHDGNALVTSQEEGNWWTLSADGLSHIVNGMTTTQVVPNAISIKNRAYWTTYDPSQQRTLLCRTAENRVLQEYDSSTNTEICSWDGTQWRNITPPNISDYGGNYWILISPNEPNTYFYCSRKLGGIAKVQNDSIVVRYRSTNSPVSERAAALAFDSKGNLWMAQSYPKDSSPDVVAISAGNQLKTSVSNADFVINNLGGICKNSNEGYKRIAFDIGAGDVKVFAPGEYAAPLVIWENNDDLSLKRYKAFDSFNDQENQYFSTWGWVYIKADNDGMIWIGTVSGVISFDPREAFNDDFHINRIKVTKDEGADVNETLLEGFQVNCISCDTQNRKWLATNSAGIYLVSADGSEILKHFNMANSPLPSDQVYSVCYNAGTNSVLVVTPKGVVEYYCDITPSQSDYSNVYAYPNPVQDTFTGYVTIQGLMDNSNVVITNARGNVVASTKSTGGTAYWDVCNTDGTPVKTGVYNVYASQGTPDTTGKPLTKIAVIK